MTTRSWFRPSTKRRPPAGRRPAVRPRLLRLEDRTVPTVITVTGTGDTIAVDGVVTLREAITAANTNLPSGDAPAGQPAATDVIQFAIPGTATQTIMIGSGGLPDITEPVTVNGTTQPGNAGAPWGVQIIGSGSPRPAFGLRLMSTVQTTIEGLVIGNFGTGIQVNGGGGNTIQNNYIGTDPTGMTGNPNGVGVQIVNAGGAGIFLQGAFVQNNLISGNTGAGLQSQSSFASVSGNLIGLSSAGGPLGNGGDGVTLSGTAVLPNLPTEVIQQNTIAYNVGNGLTDNLLIHDLTNDIGYYRFSRNSIHDNGGPGIDLGGDGVTANDNGDADTGPNGLQNYPALTSAVRFGDGLTVTGTLASTANGTFQIDFFASPKADSSGFGEGQQYLGTTFVSTDASGFANLGIVNQGLTLPAAPTGWFLTATATGPTGTSEFSKAVKIVPQVQAIQAGVMAAGPDSGTLPVQVYNTDGSLRTTFQAYPGFPVAVRVAVGDVNGDQTADIVTGAGPGGGPHVKVFDRDGNLLRSFYAYDPKFIGGVFVAAGDVDGDGFADVITGAGAGGGPHVEVFSGRTGQVIRSFFPYAITFPGGVSVAAADVNGDGYADIITGAGPGGGPHVEVFDGRTGKVLQSFFAYDPTFRGGVNVAGGDVDGDGYADIITGAGPGGGPQVAVFSGVDLTLVKAFFPYPTTFGGGVNVVAADLNHDGFAEIITAPGPNGGGNVQVYDGKTGAQTNSFMPFDPSFTGGIFVGATGPD